MHIAHQTCKRNCDRAASLYPMECFVHLLTLFILCSHLVARFSLRLSFAILMRLYAIFSKKKTLVLIISRLLMFNAHSFGINYKFVCTQISYVFNYRNIQKFYDEKKKCGCWIGINTITLEFANEYFH